MSKTIHLPQGVTPLRPLLTIRARCVEDCRGGSRKEVRECGVTDCSLHEYRLGRRPPKGTAKRTPLQALRSYCLWCCVNQPTEVRLCPAKACPCWPYRLARRPKLPQVQSEEIAPESASSVGSFCNSERARTAHGGQR